ncbi:hypothetical protein ACN38_g6956 [Penicillium nordicum]|uniref:Uncharacterized protein n=1 Tax=Penicillium nordicum TaxID=229535 RepID=A0A0M8P775_9EURO|nr:hypothetical protein ACN38_g6956 [Penicillium nordicum]
MIVHDADFNFVLALVFVSPGCVLIFSSSDRSYCLKPGGNEHISSYFTMQYHYLVGFIPPDILLGLPPEDKFFVELYGKALPPRTRERVILNRQRIRQGLMNVEEAWKSIPKKSSAG